jgi:hypothetical protein
MSSSFTNSSILSPESGYSFYVSSNGSWAAVPYQQIYIIIHNGHQVSQQNSLEDSIEYIKEQQKPKNTKILSPRFSKK